MKGLKRILCFLFVLTFCWTFVACSKNDDTPPVGETPEIEQPESGGDNEQGSGDVDEPEVYVPFVLNDLFDLGSKAIGGFVYNLNADLTDSDLFDDNIARNQSMFIGASEDNTGVLAGIEEKIARATMIPRKHGEVFTDVI